MIKEALIKKLEGEIAVAKADLKTFLNNPHGVADHIEFVASVEKKIGTISSASGKLQILINLE
jgi:hypothetical protein